MRSNIHKDIKKGGEWKGAVDADRSSFKEFMREIRRDVKEINSACQKMILVVGLYDEFGYLGVDLVIFGGFGQDLACIWGSDRIGVVRAGG